jgi:hypothetical protein
MLSWDFRKPLDAAFLQEFHVEVSWVSVSFHLQEFFERERHGGA